MKNNEIEHKSNLLDPLASSISMFTEAYDFANKRLLLLVADIKNIIFRTLEKEYKHLSQQKYIEAT